MDLPASGVVASLSGGMERTTGRPFDGAGDAPYDGITLAEGSVLVQIIQDLLREVQEGRILDARVGIFWTAVVAEVEGAVRCGLASTLYGGHTDAEPPVPQAGHLLDMSARELANMALAGCPPRSSIGLAAINALLPPYLEGAVELNAETILSDLGRNRKVALVGHFPFVERLRENVGELWVLELQPRGGDLPASAAAQVIPQADVLALTGTTLLNGTFESLMRIRRPDAQVLVLGPTTPLSPVLFRHGAHYLSGSVVDDVAAVVKGVSQAAGFRQIHRLGVRLVTLARPGVGL